MLFRSISDARIPYTYNTLPYAGKPNVITQQSEYVTGTDNYTKYLVKDFERYEPQGHNEVSKMIKNISIVPTKLPQIEQAR